MGNTRNNAIPWEDLSALISSGVVGASGARWESLAAVIASGEAEVSRETAASAKPPTLVVARPRWQRTLVLLGLLSRFRTYTGHLLSPAEFTPFAERWLKAGRGELSAHESLALVSEYLDAIGIPERVIAKLPYDVAASDLARFLGEQRKATPLQGRPRNRNSPGWG
jgi:hypothetical protein